MKAEKAGSNFWGYGIFYSLYGLFSLLFLFVFKFMLNSSPMNPSIIKMSHFFTALRSVWLIYIPIMIVIGLLYMLSGWLIKKKNQKGIAVGISASILNFFWFAGYVVSGILDVFPYWPGKLPPVAFLIIVLVFWTIVFCSYPFYFLLTFKRIEV
jgi:hypothetical protein